MVLGGSAFNIKAKSLRLGDFSEQEVRELCLRSIRRADRSGVRGGGAVRLILHAHGRASRGS